MHRQNLLRILLFPWPCLAYGNMVVLMAMVFQPYFVTSSALVLFRGEFSKSFFNRTLTVTYIVKPIFWIWSSTLSSWFFSSAMLSVLPIGQVQLRHVWNRLGKHASWYMLSRFWFRREARMWYYPLLLSLSFHSRLPHYQNQENYASMRSSASSFSACSCILFLQFFQTQLYWSSTDALSLQSCSYLKV